MIRIRKGQVIALFAFAIGFEVSLEQLGALLTSTPVQPLSQKKQTPAYLQYTKPPRIVNLGEAAALSDEPGTIRAMVFDFGATSIAYQWPLTAPGQDLPLASLPQLSRELYSRNLEAQARAQVQRLMEKIETAIVRPELSELLEDYYLFILRSAGSTLEG